jgi:hypothetical protein
MLRKAFDATMKDPEFIADAKKSRIDLEPIGGAEVQKMVADMFNLSPALIAKLRDALK